MTQRIRTKNGYVVGACCNKNHSGNRRLAPSQGHYECQGCGEFHTRDSVVAAIVAKRELDNSGGVCAG